MYKIITAALFFLTAVFVKAQPSSVILDQMQQFNTFTTVLYLAAHPDDENTRVISWLVNGEHARTGYLSLTRGDGGQNLIGKEFSEELGILRTRELLAARSIDGGEQFFSRAVDFGYSRNAEETLEKWDEEKILADVVWVIRKFKPQLIITRFPPDERAGHGHHTASAMLAIKAFDAAADPSKFPEQLTFVEPWQVQSVYWNGSTWWDKTLESDMQTDSAIWRADIGGYNPLTGKSHNELGSLARSQHKCQGFGVDIQRGETFEYFRPLVGKALYKGIESIDKPDWKTLGVPQIEKMLAIVQANFNPNQPEKSLPALAEIYNELSKIKDAYWREQKQAQCRQMLVDCAGLYVEATTEKFAFQANEVAKINVNILSRLAENISIDGLSCGKAAIMFKKASPLPLNQFATFELEVELPAKTSNPYWLEFPHKNLYTVVSQELIGKPENDALLHVNTNLLVNDFSIPIEIPVRYKWQDRVEGEQQREIVVVPPMCINFSQPMSLNLNGEPVELNATIKWFEGDKDVAVQFSAEGWKIELLSYEMLENKVNFQAKGAGKEEQLRFKLTPLNGAKQGALQAVFSDGTHVREYHEIAYSHIPTQVYMPAAIVQLTNLEVKTIGTKVGYIQGAGDRVDEAIAQMGYAVEFLDETNIYSADLTQFQAIVIGIRAYNTLSWLPNFNDQLLQYVANGGNVIVQYNTAGRFSPESFVKGPFPFEIGRGRVTEEDAAVEILLSKNSVLNAPNKITEQDFEGWVQERGLYFAQTWDENYEAPLAWHDKDQEIEKGALIIANYGKGAYIYTGISFFRQVPVGVPGAYRLLANLISYQNRKR